MSTFAKRLRELLDSKGLTQADLSRMCGLSRATLSRYLQGQFEAKQDSIYKIARATNVSEAWLMGADVPMDHETASRFAYPTHGVRLNPAPQISDREIRAAFFNGYGDDLSEDEQDALWSDAKAYMQFKLSQRKHKKEGE